MTANNLTELPHWIGDFRKLNTLDLSGNPLPVLPGQLSKLKNLRILGLMDLELTELPDWLLDLPRLRVLAVGGNPLLSPPPEIVANGMSSILEFLRARREQGSARQWTSKMLVVGEGGVGKTSTIKALFDSEFNRAEETTHGLKIYRYWAKHPQRRSRRSPKRLRRSP